MITPVGLADIRARVASYRSDSTIGAGGRLGLGDAVAAAPTAADASSFQSALESVSRASARTASFAASSSATASMSTVAAALRSSNGTVSGVPFADMFNAAGAKYGVSPQVLAAVAKVESNYHTEAVSGAGAVGMMQLMPSTAASLGVDPLDPAAAVDGAARLIASMTQRFGSVDLALAAYNVGPGTIARVGGIQPGSQAETYVNAVYRALEAL